VIRLPLVLSVLLVSACANTPTPQYDARFGSAVREARMLQTLNPTPSMDPQLGLDGKAAKEAAGRYVESYKTPPPPVNVINIGGQISGGGGR
jgi:hypothetical protein